MWRWFARQGYPRWNITFGLLMIGFGAVLAEWVIIGLGMASVALGVLTLLSRRSANPSH